MQKKEFVPWNKGKKGLQVSPNKNKPERFIGDKNPNWRGGTAKESSKKWREKNKERIRYLNGRRRALKSGSQVKHSFDEWNTLKRIYNFTCPCCFRKEPEIKLTVDHILPLCKGGQDCINNIQPLCLPCNMHKHTRIIKYDRSISRVAPSEVKVKKAPAKKHKKLSGGTDVHDKRKKVPKDFR